MRIGTRVRRTWDGALGTLVRWIGGRALVRLDGPVAHTLWLDRAVLMAA